MLRGTPRHALPERAPESSVLGQLYGEVQTEALEWIGRQLVVRGIDAPAVSIDVDNIAPLLSDPDAYRALADQVGSIDATDPLARFTASLAPDLARFAELLGALREQARAVLEEAGEPADAEAVETYVQWVLSGRLPLPVMRFLRVAVRGKAPVLDRAIVTALTQMYARVIREWRAAMHEQAMLGLDNAGAAGSFAVLDALRRHRTA